MWSLDSKEAVSTIVVVGMRAGHQMLLCVESPRGMESERPLPELFSSLFSNRNCQCGLVGEPMHCERSLSTYE